LDKKIIMRVLGVQTKKNVKGIEWWMEYFIYNITHLCHPTLKGTNTCNDTELLRSVRNDAKSKHNASLRGTKQSRN
ncbi:MAG: hypothetical protein LBT04_09315, partial [Prevotellaceae bacterium]|nr:hypothetical protein [Prevotellaceae bacterium]